MDIEVTGRNIREMLGIAFEQCQQRHGHNITEVAEHCSISTTAAWKYLRGQGDIVRMLAALNHYAEYDIKLEIDLR